MLGIFKKKCGPRERALHIAETTSNYSEGLVEAVDNFINQSPEYLEIRNVIIDELQWIIATGGIISIRILSDHKKAKETYQQLIEFYRLLHKSNSESTMFDNDYLKKLNQKFDKYTVRFNRGVVFRDDTLDSYNETLLDVANESMIYFTGEIRHSEIMSIDEIDSLQERLYPPNNLELFIKEILQQFIKVFIKEFEKVKIV